MATLATISQDVRDQLYGAFPTEAPFVTTLASSHDDTSASIVVLEEDNWAPQDVLENLDTGEQMLVLSVTADDSDTLTVIRGWNGTTAAASDGSDDTLLKNPRFTEQQITRAIYDAQATLGNYGIHAFTQAQITRADPLEFYELAVTDIDDTYGVLKVFEVEANTEIPRPLPFRYQKELGTDPSEYAQPRGIWVLDWGETSNTEAVQYIYAQVITGDATGTALLTDLQADLVAEGAVARLLGGTIVPATHDPGARSDRTVQPGQTGRDWGVFQSRFIGGCRMEAGALAVKRQKLLQETAKYSRARRWVN